MVRKSQCHIRDAKSTLCICFKVLAHHRYTLHSAIYVTTMSNFYNSQSLKFRDTRPLICWNGNNFPTNPSNLTQNCCSCSVEIRKYWIFSQPTSNLLPPSQIRTLYTVVMAVQHIIYINVLIRTRQTRYTILSHTCENPIERSFIVQCTEANKHYCDDKPSVL